MMLLPCPWCGPRDEAEFVCGGERIAPRPEDPAALDEAAWLTRLLLRDNRRGPHVERWWHAKGCGTWFAITRDTVTHELAGEPPA